MLAMNGMSLVIGIAKIVLPLAFEASNFGPGATHFGSAAYCCRRSLTSAGTLDPPPPEEPLDPPLSLLLLEPHAETNSAPTTIARADGPLNLVKPVMCPSPPAGSWIPTH